MRSWLEKLFLTLPLVGLACLLAALYGALHNQLSYTLSPEYFEHFKFPLFDIPPDQYNREGAALVGMQAGWWMGLVIGFPIALAGILQPDWRRMLRQTWQAYLLVIGFTTLFAALGLAASWIMVPDNGLINFTYPAGVVDPQAFSRAGFMHDASHVGGFMGIVLGTLFQLFQALRDYHLPANQSYTSVGLPLPAVEPSIPEATGGKALRAAPPAAAAPAATVPAPVGGPGPAATGVEGPKPSPPRT